MKIAPVYQSLKDHAELLLLHTGQHYDAMMSDTILESLSLPDPDRNLGVRAGTHAQQTAAVMVGAEMFFSECQPDVVVVPGDVNSTLGAALAASKLNIPLVHLEAGLRSFDRRMPEEINRVLVDQASDLLLAHCDDARENLMLEGISPTRIRIPGNTMIDSLFGILELLPDARLCAEDYVLVTLHRPSLVDDPLLLAATISALEELNSQIKVIFPAHPRVYSMAQYLATTLEILPPMGYTEFIHHERDAKLVITDSGGVQEETSALDVPCLTYRTTTERPITITHGTNQLVGLNPDLLMVCATHLLKHGLDHDTAPIPLWDGNAGSRAASDILAYFDDQGSEWQPESSSLDL